MKALKIALAVICLSGCPAVNPASGTIKCSTDPLHLCPDGYVCAVGRCWKDGQQPTTQDLAISDSSGDKQNGVACTTASECASKFCADGVCCNTACNDSCNACNVSGNPGVCSPVPSGNVPVLNHTSCGPDSKTSCGRDGMCDGQGSCHLWSASTQCKPASCDPTSSAMVPAAFCDGSGVCVVPNKVNCSPYKCLPDNSACVSKCVVDTDCVPPASCSLPAQSCGPKQIGNQCGSGTECTTGNCVDGHCCDKPQSACNGCNACNVGPNLGVCSPVAAGNDPHATCPYPCSGGCNGAGACSSGSSMTVCAFSCTDTCSTVDSVNFSVNGQCTGRNASVGTCTNNPGLCGAPTAEYCPGNFTCGSSTACNKTCNKDADCLAGYFCSGPSGTCLAQLPLGDVCTRSSQCQTVSSTLGDAQCSGSCRGCVSNADCFGSTCNNNGTCIGQCTVDADCTSVGAGSRCTSVGNHNICTCTTDSDCTDHRARGCFTVKSFPSVKACTCNTTAFNGNGGTCRFAYSCTNWGTNGYCLVASGGVCTSNTVCASGLCQANGTCF